MSIDIRLRTGFFETKPYRLLIIDKDLVFYPLNHERDGKIVLHEESVLSVSLMQKATKLEISTKNAAYSCILNEEYDWTELFKFFSKLNGAKIIYDYENDRYDA